MPASRRLSSRRLLMRRVSKSGSTLSGDESAELSDSPVLDPSGTMPAKVDNTVADPPGQSEVVGKVSSDGTPPDPEYQTFKMLLDLPAERPGLDFDAYKSALAETILRSDAEFALGIFGSWGTGKTTLMRAVQQLLAKDAGVVTVWFTAWRYEREQHLIVPLLDVLRQSLLVKADDNYVGEERASRAKRAAESVGKAGRAFLAGLNLSLITPVFQASLDTGRMIDAMTAMRELPEQQGQTSKDFALSLYHRAFVELDDAIRELSSDRTLRVVIFIDDLDRCSADNAISVLEAIKLFFDTEGCVFVVGLDREVIEQALTARYDKRDDLDGAQMPRVQGAEYLSKIFQVGFTLPPVWIDRIGDYLQTICDDCELGPEQTVDLIENVSKHFEYLDRDLPANPREIKRLVNAYTLQMRILSRKLVEANRNVVLALLCMSTRRDWHDWYDKLAIDPALFRETMSRDLRSRSWPEEKLDVVWFGTEEWQLPAGLEEYLRGPAAVLFEARDLAVYVSAAESMSQDSWSLTALVLIARLRQVSSDVSLTEVESKEAMEEVARGLSEIRRHLRALAELVSSRGEAQWERKALRDRLARGVAELEKLAADPSGQRWLTEAEAVIGRIEEQLRQLRWEVGAGRSQ
jgi:ABC-type enterochelin transport system ATPase subunit